MTASRFDDASGTVRDHKYMTRILDTILVAWRTQPELRLAQLLSNASPVLDLFYTEDDQLATQTLNWSEERSHPRMVESADTPASATDG